MCCHLLQLGPVWRYLKLMVTAGDQGGDQAGSRDPGGNGDPTVSGDQCDQTELDLLRLGHSVVQDAVLMVIEVNLALDGTTGLQPLLLVAVTMALLSMATAYTCVSMETSHTCVSSQHGAKSSQLESGTRCCHVFCPRSHVVCTWAGHVTWHVFSLLARMLAFSLFLRTTRLWAVLAPTAHLLAHYAVIYVSLYLNPVKAAPDCASIVRNFLYGYTQLFDHVGSAQHVCTACVYFVVVSVENVVMVTTWFIGAEKTSLHVGLFVAVCLCHLIGTSVGAAVNQGWRGKGPDPEPSSRVLTGSVAMDTTQVPCAVLDTVQERRRKDTNAVQVAVESPRVVKGTVAMDTTRSRSVVNTAAVPVSDKATIDTDEDFDTVIEYIGDGDSSGDGRGGELEAGERAERGRRGEDKCSSQSPKRSAPFHSRADCAARGSNAASDPACILRHLVSHGQGQSEATSPRQQQLKGDPEIPLDAACVLRDLVSYSQAQRQSEGLGREPPLPWQQELVLQVPNEASVLRHFSSIEDPKSGTPSSWQQDLTLQVPTSDSQQQQQQQQQQMDEDHDSSNSRNTNTVVSSVSGTLQGSYHGNWAGRQGQNEAAIQTETRLGSSHGNRTKTQKEVRTHWNPTENKRKTPMRWWNAVWGALPHHPAQPKRSPRKGMPGRTFGRSNSNFERKWNSFSNSPYENVILRGKVRNAHGPDGLRSKAPGLMGRTSVEVRACGNTQKKDGVALQAGAHRRAAGIRHLLLPCRKEGPRPHLLPPQGPRPHVIPPNFPPNHPPKCPPNLPPHLSWDLDLYTSDSSVTEYAVLPGAAPYVRDGRDPCRLGGSHYGHGGAPYGRGCGPFGWDDDSCSTCSSSTDYLELASCESGEDAWTWPPGRGAGAPGRGAGAQGRGAGAPGRGGGLSRETLRALPRGDDDPSRNDAVTRWLCNISDEQFV